MGRPRKSKGSVYKPASKQHYRIKVYQDGQPKTIYTGTDDPDEAARQLRTVQTDLDRGLPVQAAMGKVRWDEAVQDLITDYENNEYDTLDDTRRRLELHLTPYFKGRRLASIAAADIRNYVNKRKKDTYVPATRVKDGKVIAKGTGKPRPYSNAQINRELTVLKRMFTLEVKELGKLAHMPHIPMLDESKAKRKGFLSLEDLENLVVFLSPPFDDIARVAFLTGWRVDSEIVPLEWRHVDFEANELRLDPQMAKNDDGRAFTLTDDLRAIFVRLHGEHRARLKHGQVCPAVFVRMLRKGRQGEPTPRPARAFWKAWARARTKAHMPGRMPHDMRRSAARNMVRRGLPERVAMELGGWKTRSVFDRYNITNEADRKAAQQQLSGQFSPRRWKGEQGEER